MTSNAVAPSVTPPSPDEWPQDLILQITNISKSSQAQVTSPLHGFTQSDVNTTFIMIKQVKGMIQINGINALIKSIVDVNNFTINIDSTNFATYRSAGVVIIDSGEPVIQQQGSQFFNTPFQNIAYRG